MGRVVSIVLVTWNSTRFLPRSLAGISAQSYGDTELIHIDNGSADDSSRQVRAAFPRCLQIVNDENRGFAAAVNQGVRRSRGDFILLLNPDAFLQPEYIRKIVDALDAAGDTFGMATGKLIRARGAQIEPTDEIDSMGIRMTRSGRHLDITADSGQRSADSEVFGVSGAAAVYRRSFVDDVTMDGEFLDEDFFSFREDADVAWRGRLFGWRALYVAQAIAYHVRTVTPERRRDLPDVINMHSVKNRFLLRLKNEGAYLALRNALFEIPRDLITIAAVLTVERSSRPALWWLWRNRSRIMAKRRAVQSRRRISDRLLAEWFR